MRSVEAKTFLVTANKCVGHVRVGSAVGGARRHFRILGYGNGNHANHPHRVDT
jgi:hypothetical protein